MQYRKCELEMDMAQLFNLILCDPKFEELLKDLTHKKAKLAVIEAFDLLHSASGPRKEGGQKDLTSRGCMVVFLLQQLLVRLLTKRLMLLMTTESVILNRNKIPKSYLENYLSNQAHFSLVESITNYLHM